MGRLLDKYKLVHTGDFLRQYAQEHDLFIYPYDLQTGADIALYENTEARQEAQRYFVCSLAEVSQETDKTGAYEIPEQCELVYTWRESSAANFEGALAHWNTRMQQQAKTLQKPFWSRFISLESGNMAVNFICFGCIYFVISKITFLYELLQEYALPIIFLLLCSNLENIFTKSYGEEIPRKTLEKWGQRHSASFQADLYAEAMAAWPEVRESHQKGLPYYLLRKRGLLQHGEEKVAELTETAQEGPEETSYQAYCQEIISKLEEQLAELEDRRRKISDRAVSLQLEKILKVLREIRLALGKGDSEARVIAARKVVSYWNEETLSLLDNHLLFLQNSSREAEETQKKILSLLQDLAPVYRKELGRITATHTMEVKASMEVLQKEIDEVLSRER